MKKAELRKPPLSRLACACCLLLAGSIADKVGDRPVNLIGSATLAASVLANGLARSGAQLVALRALQGVGVSMCLPTGVSIVARSLLPGRGRNVGFSCLGVAQPLGFSLGLVVEGAVEAAGDWRLGYHVCAAVLAAFVVANWLVLPPPDGRVAGAAAADWGSVGAGVDWVGIAVSSVGLGLVSYTCAYVFAG